MSSNCGDVCVALPGHLLCGKAAGHEGDHECTEGTMRGIKWTEW